MRLGTFAILCLFVSYTGTVRAGEEANKSAAASKKHDTAAGAGAPGTAGGTHPALPEGAPSLGGAVQVPEVIDASDGKSGEIEFEANAGLDPIRSALAFLDDREAELNRQPDSEEKTKGLELVKKMREKTLQTAKKTVELQKSSEGALLTSAYNFCFVGVEIGLLRIKQIKSTLGFKGRLCLTFGNQINRKDGAVKMPVVALTTFIGGQLEPKDRGKPEWIFGAGIFVVHDHSNFKKVKMSDLEGAYWGGGAEVPLPTGQLMSKNAGVYLPSLHRRLGSRTKLTTVGPTVNSLGKYFNKPELTVPFIGEKSFIPYIESDIYYYEPLGIAISESGTPNLQTELLYFKNLKTYNGEE
jgi:hypothetical protein